jgi:hypothetical protein
MPPYPSAAGEYYDQIRNADDRFGFLDALVNPKQPTHETDWLDMA